MKEWRVAEQPADLTRSLGHSTGSPKSRCQGPWTSLSLCTVCMYTSSPSHSVQQSPLKAIVYAAPLLPHAADGIAAASWPTATGATNYNRSYPCEIPGWRISWPRVRHAACLRQCRLAEGARMPYAMAMAVTERRSSLSASLASFPKS